MGAPILPQLRSIASECFLRKHHEWVNYADIHSINIYLHVKDTTSVLRVPYRPTFMRSIPGCGLELFWIPELAA